MITMILPVEAGNALKIYLNPPDGSKFWRVYKKGGPTVEGIDDPEAVLVVEGNDRYYLDDFGLINDVQVWYSVFYNIDGDWVLGNTVSAIPHYSLEDISPDTLDVLVARLVSGLEEVVRSGEVTPASGYIPVLTSPPSMDTGPSIPCVTVTYNREGPEEHMLGMVFLGDRESQPDGSGWFDSEGWMASVDISVTAWSINPEERRTLRKVLRRIIIGNAAVWDSHGMVKVTFTTSDDDDFERFEPPMYLVAGTFRCLAPVVVGGLSDDRITDVIVEGKGI